MRRRGSWREGLLAAVPALAALALFMLHNMGKSWAAAAEAAGIIAILLLFGGSIYALLTGMPTWSASWLGVTSVALTVGLFLSAMALTDVDNLSPSFAKGFAMIAWYGPIIITVLLLSLRDWTLASAAALSWASTWIFVSIGDLWPWPWKLVAILVLALAWGIPMVALVVASGISKVLAIIGGMVVVLFLRPLAFPLFYGWGVQRVLARAIDHQFWSIFLLGPFAWLVRNRILPPKAT